jgi:hypothetical protein
MLRDRFNLPDGLTPTERFLRSRRHAYAGAQIDAVLFFFFNGTDIFERPVGAGSG